MKKTLNKMLALALAASFALTACGGESEKPENTDENNQQTETKTEEKKDDKKEADAKNDGKEIKELVLSALAVNEVSSFNMLYSQSQTEGDVLSNLVESLLEINSYGELLPGIAKEWGSEDGGLTWTFNLRDNVKWVDVNANEKADCTAQDFLTGLEWVLNFHKNDSVNTSMPNEMIKGAQEYYEYTKGLSKEEAYELTAGEGSKFLEMVGIEAPDDYTVVYHCIQPKPYFDTVATYGCLYPMAQSMVDELGVDGVKSMNNETMWYNGCYTMTSYIQGNEKVYTKNPTYWDKDCKLFDTVTTRMVESNDVAYQLYQSGEIDEVNLTESNLKTISGDTNNQFYDYRVEKIPTKYSWGFYFNYDKNKEDGTPDTNWNLAVANEAFRLSWYYGFDMSPWYTRTNSINPMSCENNFYTMKGLCYTSDGKDYTDLVAEELGLPALNGEKMVRLDEEKAKQYKEQAIEELTALGVTFPIDIDYYISGSNQTALDSANVLKQAFADSLGDDYVKLNIKTYVSSMRKEVADLHLQSIASTGWGADYGDPQNYLAQMNYGDDNAYISDTYSNINDVEENENTQELINQFKEYTEMVRAADQICDNMDERYAAYAKAEAYAIEHAFMIPSYYDIGWCLTKVNPYSKMNALYGGLNNKMKNWETNSDGYTTDEVAALKEAHDNRA